MSRTEQRQMVAMLGVMQQQFENATGGELPNGDYPRHRRKACVQQ